MILYNLSTIIYMSYETKLCESGLCTKNEILRRCYNMVGGGITIVCPSGKAPTQRGKAELSSAGK